MLSKKSKQLSIPDLTEFIDDEGTKWVQTSTDDLFSSKELNEILESVDRDRDAGEIILARIDFQKVNKEYYEKVLELQSKLKKRNEMLKRLLIDAKQSIDRKNAKLKELIDYIKKLHVYLKHANLSAQDLEKARILPLEEETPMAVPENKPPVAVEYADVDEIVLDDEGKDS